MPGRFEPVDEGQQFAVLVDYAHTPDSLENVLLAARALAEGRVHVVFGCGGDRDRGKRPLMGEIATRLADRAIVTSDNPRSEDPAAIIAEVLVGAGQDTTLAVDRREAISEAIAGAAPGDVVVIAGKGHEQGQEFEGGRKIAFDDVTVAREVLRSAALARDESLGRPRIAREAGAALVRHAAADAGPRARGDRLAPGGARRPVRGPARRHRRWRSVCVLRAGGRRLGGADGPRARADARRGPGRG